jgi:hypothetical protein
LAEVGEMCMDAVVGPVADGAVVARTVTGHVELGGPAPYAASRRDGGSETRLAVGEELAAGRRLRLVAEVVRELGTDFVVGPVQRCGDAAGEAELTSPVPLAALELHLAVKTAAAGGLKAVRGRPARASTHERAQLAFEAGAAPARGAAAGVAG